MSELKKRKRTDAPDEAQSYTKQHTVNGLGIPQVVLLPDGEKDARTGIPVSLDLTPLFGHMPQEFQREFYKALHAQGLIEPSDYFAPDASERYRRALFTVIKHDFLSIQALAQQEIKHG